MSDPPLAEAAAGAVPEQIPTEVGASTERSVGEIREEFGSTVVEIKQRYTLLLDERERRIKELATKLAQGPSKPPPRHVLIIDDAESTGAIAVCYLKAEAVEVTRVAAAGARAALQSRAHDAVLIEATCVIEPGVDGLTLARQLRDGGDGKPVVVMSSRPGDKVRVCVEQAGAMFLRKPFGRAQLLELVRGTLLKEK
jgi:CheY-like chemotaxis protein